MKKRKLKKEEKKEKKKKKKKNAHISLNCTYRLITFVTPFV